MEATCVPWAAVSYGSISWPSWDQSMKRRNLPCRSACAPSKPVSMMAITTSSPVTAADPSRDPSTPMDCTARAPVWTVAVSSSGSPGWLHSTWRTSGLAATARAWAYVRSAAKPP
jgi:hypothetical protein